MNSDIAGRLKEALVAAGMKQRTLAKKTGMTEASISRYVNGERVPGVKALNRIAEVLGVSIDFLIGAEGSGLKPVKLIVAKPMGNVTAYNLVDAKIAVDNVDGIIVGVQIE